MTIRRARAMDLEGLNRLLYQVEDVHRQGRPDLFKLHEKKYTDEELLALIDADAEAFAPLSRAYSLPKDTPDRAEILENCLRQAASAPKKIADACCAVIELAEGCAACGSRLVLSDAATAAALARGALKGAVINVKVNTTLMHDRAYADTLAAEMAEKEREYTARADAVCDAVAVSLGF